MASRNLVIDGREVEVFPISRRGNKERWEYFHFVFSGGHDELLDLTPIGSPFLVVSRDPTGMDTNEILGENVERYLGQALVGENPFREVPDPVKLGYSRGFDHTLCTNLSVGKDNLESSSINVVPYHFFLVRGVPKDDCLSDDSSKK